MGEMEYRDFKGMFDYVEKHMGKTNMRLGIDGKNVEMVNSNQKDAKFSLDVLNAFSSLSGASDLSLFKEAVYKYDN